MAVRDIANPPILESVAKATNPADNAVMADTGDLSAGFYEVRVIVGASVAAIFDIERRNAGNTANVGDVVTVYTPAGASAEVVLTYEVVLNESIRVIMDGALTGTAAAAIQVERLT